MELTFGNTNDLAGSTGIFRLEDLFNSILAKNRRFRYSGPDIFTGKCSHYIFPVYKYINLDYHMVAFTLCAVH